MSESKIQIKVGHVEFSGEGNQDWLSTQLDKILGRVPELLKIELSNPLRVDSKSGSGISSAGAKDRPKNLALFIKDKNATTNQVKKFLATAAFLQFSGKTRMTTSDIVKALKDSNQNRIGNPSDVLQKNIAKGHCEKDGGKDFFVTSEGLLELGMGTE